MSTTDGEMTPAELSRNLGRLEVTITAGFKSVEEKLDKYVLQEVHAAQMLQIQNKFGDLERDIADQQSRTRWVVGLLVAAVVPLIIAVLNIYL
jgi:hypothetical protein